nr:nuclear body protein SP140-like protein isoform X1 [Zootoca vivipara]XP_034988617.1 nuclear body protein SP140-like protein isoform X1 [Zootoca vivipara]XP_034988618.1 nuclear body protein SP140-like protein isoform X1 [Zootoca vivipara]XP_034988619.1 nuclear body protein SP140-like protein isoform X1 [Zootoca vivipara]XP_034988620.1 nuclear body protein SP140-like protein isoform X1 [Zootoca vivipara]
MSALGTSGEVLEWFRANKMQISAAIKDLFPFLFILRDKKIISEEQFKNCSEQVSSNANALHRVIYNVLESISNNVSAVKEIFCQENLEAYQNLKPIFESLGNVLQRATNSSTTGLGSKNILQAKKNNSEFSGPKGLPFLPTPKFDQEMSELYKKKFFSEGEASTSYQGLKFAGATESMAKMSQGPTNTCFKMGGVPKGKGIQNINKGKPNVQGSTVIVTCGKTKGVLYKEKLAAGAAQKSIKGFKGTWFTPQEFLTEGEIAGTNWRRSIRSQGITLESLIKDGMLPEPARASLGKNKPANDGICEVCMEEGSDLCCFSCNKSFHYSCHVPEELVMKRFWKCTFCKWKGNLYVKEDQVLKGKMAAKAKNTCEFLLLKIWCEPEGAVFADEPVIIQTHGDNCPNNPIWLKRIKEKLNINQYETVGDFIGDMRLMFSNFLKFHQGQDVAEDGRKLQNEFEKSFREAFFIRN